MKRIIEFVKKYIFALASCVYLFTVGILSVRHRSFIERICGYFGQKKQFTQELPAVYLEELIPEEPLIQIREAASASGNVTLSELITIVKLVRFYKPQTVFEIGTFDGRTALNMAANITPDAKLYTLDLPRDKLKATKFLIAQGDKEFINKEASGTRFLKTDCESKITQLYGDSAVFDFSAYESQIDFVFVDGSHAYDYVLSDTEKAMKLLKNGRGVILWHDYGGWEGATKSLNELYLKDARFKHLKHIKGTSLACLIAS